MKFKNTIVYRSLSFKLTNVVPMSRGGGDVCVALRAPHPPSGSATACIQNNVKYINDALSLTI